MKREIIFRGKCIRDSKWVYGWYFERVEQGTHHRGQINHYIILTKDGEEYEVDPNTVGECSGLTDKNGNMIYEHDIIVFYQVRGLTIDIFNYPQQEEDIVKVEDEVKFENGEFITVDSDIPLSLLSSEFRVTTPSKIIDMYFNILNKDEFPFIENENDLLFAEVIGNIHDEKKKV